MLRTGIGAVHRISGEQKHRERLLGRHGDLQELAAEQGIFDNGLAEGDATDRDFALRRTIVAMEARPCLTLVLRIGGSTLNIVFQRNTPTLSVRRPRVVKFHNRVHRAVWIVRND